MSSILVIHAADCNQLSCIIKHCNCLMTLSNLPKFHFHQVMSPSFTKSEQQKRNCPLARTLRTKTTYRVSTKQYEHQLPLTRNARTSTYDHLAWLGQRRPLQYLVTMVWHQRASQPPPLVHHSPSIRRFLTHPIIIFDFVIGSVAI